MRSGPVFCLLLGVSSDYAQPITGQVTEVTCPVIGRAQPELTPNKRQKTGPDLLDHSYNYDDFKGKTVVSPLLAHWRYHNVALWLLSSFFIWFHFLFSCLNIGLVSGLTHQGMNWLKWWYCHKIFSEWLHSFQLIAVLWLGKNLWHHHLVKASRG